MTHFALRSGRGVEIVNIIDDHSRLCIASVALGVARALDVVEIFQQARQRYGTPAALLTDIQAGCVPRIPVAAGRRHEAFGDRRLPVVVADRSERLWTTPCLLGTRRVGATPGV
jgi:hypothetical protein